MIDLLPAPNGPFALARLPEQLAPRRRVRVAGVPAAVAGSIVCVDRDEAWLECLLRLDDGSSRWLAVEARGSCYRTTLWDRSIETAMPSALSAFGRETLAGVASFRSHGEFDAFPIPRTGLLTYREAARGADGLPATAAEQFAPRGPWLVGRGDGADIEVEVDPRLAPAGSARPV
jgi:hypothetical protein